MNLKTEVHIAKPARPIEHSDRVFMIGSCFAENMAERMKRSGIRTASNPFGVMYNPLSIAACIDRLLEGKPFGEDELIQYGGMYHSMMHHGAFSATDKATCLERINSSLREGERALREADIIIITWGTAWIYEFEGNVAGNCHKLPADRFTRRRLSPEEIAIRYRQLIGRADLRDKRFIFTVSPIRHIKDGLHENQLSKATLLLATDMLRQDFPELDYFPSYEIMNDELRDYRFYADDMLHPSALAEQYIWERFTGSRFSASALASAKECEDFFRAGAHRPLHPDSAQYQQFAEALQQKREALLKKYPYLRTE